MSNSNSDGLYHAAEEVEALGPLFTCSDVFVKLAGNATWASIKMHHDFFKSGLWKI